MQVQLCQTWILGQQIGGGGFGKVYEAKSETVESAVIKLVPKVPGAQRELLFAGLTDVRNVMPILDQGETDDAWALVMPRADKSLCQYLGKVGLPLDQDEAVLVISDIAMALSDLEDQQVVHRDIKPENILLHDGHWCLADFGISRFAEATTSPDTRKLAMSPAYAAPERWRHERATTATDVYALGVLAYEMLSGSLPFGGPGWDDLRDQHLHDDPAVLSGVPVLLAGLIDECLSKAPAARPRPANLLTRLGKVAATPASPGLAALQSASHAEGARRNAAARQASAQKTEAERRSDLNRAADRALQQIATAVRDAIAQFAPQVDFSVGLPIGWTARLNQADLRIEPPSSTAPNPWGSWSGPAFEVIAYSAISVAIPENRYGYEGRSHSLWYCDARETNRYQWYETAFMMSPLSRQLSHQDPFALNPNEDSAKALGGGYSQVQFAWPFTPLTVGDLDEFIGRWAGWLADAAQGQLNRPSAMPERSPQGSWRQS